MRGEVPEREEEKNGENPSPSGQHHAYLRMTTAKLRGKRQVFGEAAGVEDFDGRK